MVLIHIFLQPPLPLRAQSMVSRPTCVAHVSRFLRMCRASSARTAPSTDEVPSGPRSTVHLIASAVDLRNKRELTGSYRAGWCGLDTPIDLLRIDNPWGAWHIL